MATTSPATAATRRACRSTSPGEDPLLFDLGTGLRYFGLTRPGDEPFRGSCLLSHLHWDHVQGLPFFGPLQHEDSELVVYAPAQDDGPHRRRGARATICPPMFPVGLDGFPGQIEIREPAAKFRIGGFDVESGAVPHVGDALGYRVTHRGRERRLRQRPPAAA